ncbi:hypothetical protein NQ317_005527 [Molorchus minor]|uniref:Uncharacterized protein n=1 Tax=Molorchus minor TaxID=1323400 RepID=A0ABQ9IZ29_9CUCU|nr:hypothetical protein NQ317_005527 [Molorchus minor]
MVRSPGNATSQGNREGPSLELNKCLLGMNRRYRVLTGLLTVHCHLSRQLIGIAEDPECRWCLGEDEDAPLPKRWMKYSKESCDAFAIGKYDIYVGTQSDDYPFLGLADEDESGKSQTHQETRNGDKVSGEYRVMQPDGMVRVVRYTADPKKGFKATLLPPAAEVKKEFREPRCNKRGGGAPKRPPQTQELGKRAHTMPMGIDMDSFLE